MSLSRVFPKMEITHAEQGNTQQPVPRPIHSPWFNPIASDCNRSPTQPHLPDHINPQRRAQGAAHQAPCVPTTTAPPTQQPIAIPVSPTGSGIPFLTASANEKTGYTVCQNRKPKGRPPALNGGVLPCWEWRCVRVEKKFGNFFRLGAAHVLGTGGASCGEVIGWFQTGGSRKHKTHFSRSGLWLWPRWEHG